MRLLVRALGTHAVAESSAEVASRSAGTRTAAQHLWHLPLLDLIRCLLAWLVTRLACRGAVAHHWSWTATNPLPMRHSTNQASPPLLRRGASGHGQRRADCQPVHLRHPVSRQQRCCTVRNSTQGLKSTCSRRPSNQSSSHQPQASRRLPDLAAKPGPRQSCSPHRPLSPPPRSAITAEQFGALALPVAEFLAVEHGTAYLGYSATTSEHAKCVWARAVGLQVRLLVGACGCCNLPVRLAPSGRKCAWLGVICRLAGIAAPPRRRTLSVLCCPEWPPESGSWVPAAARTPAGAPSSCNHPLSCSPASPALSLQPFPPCRHQS